ncbi:major facilitator superfamily domain-containing protein [Schizophyllum amplum]|uniref:Major facilitator superfamily domain-containing protein n=1 Tax=Schizophyllum amplum TaxID=97359 RepID=A0A550CTD7_9AGAR|nr:major facilitator superfamily domain-containing protein [Auriculariopsis ampla]
MRLTKFSFLRRSGPDSVADSRRDDGDSQNLDDVKEKDVESDAAQDPNDVHPSHLPHSEGHGLDGLHDESAQPGVRQAAAITQTWTKTSLIIVYVFMFGLYMVNAFQSSITSNLSAFVTSDFQSHSLLPVIAIVSNVMSAATYMVVAKVLNLWDRSVGLAVMTMFATLGLVLSATCKDIGTYSASQIFYGIGFSGMIFCVDVITADTSTLKSRGLAYAFTSSPYIITAYAGSKASEHFVDTNWRWGFGIFAIILPFVALPLFVTLQYNKRLAAKNGLVVTRESSDRTLMQSIIYYIIEFDVLGVFLIAGGLVLFLLPFSIIEQYGDSWRSPGFIAMVIIGFFTLVAFGLVERYVAPKPFIPWRLLTNRTVLGACLIDFTYQISYYCWDDYYQSFLLVVFDTSVAEAGYIASIFDVVNGVWLIGVGFLIRRTGRFRWLLVWSVPLFMLFQGLMIYFRRPGMSIGYIVMCQVFMAIGGGAIIICEQVAVLAVSSQNNNAALLALLGLFGYIGGAVGSAVSGAIWTNTLPGALQKYLPAESLADWEDIYNSIDVQLSYPVGDPTRTAIQLAYGDAQSRMLIAGTAIMTLALGFVFLIKNIKLSDLEQVKGVLF